MSDMRLDKRITVRVSDEELAAIEQAAVRERRSVSDVLRLMMLGHVPAANPVPVVDVVSDGWSYTPTDAGAARLDEIAARDGCTRDEAARRVFKYGAWKMPARWSG
jgi:hypothetical protein